MTHHFLSPTLVCGIRVLQPQTLRGPAFNSAALTALLYWSETWFVYRRHVQKLEQFHMRCLRCLAYVRWQEKKSNTKVLPFSAVNWRKAHVLAVNSESQGCKRDV